MMMTRTLMIVAEMAIVTWVTLMLGSLIRAKAWTPRGMMWALGNRDEPIEPVVFAERTGRMARNTLENYVLFAALALVASVGGVTDPHVELGARIFFWARLAYIPVYMIGVPVARTGVWALGCVGLAMIFGCIVGALPPGA